jgi:hypothetical protein
VVFGHTSTMKRTVQGSSYVPSKRLKVDAAAAEPPVYASPHTTQLGTPAQSSGASLTKQEKVTAKRRRRRERKQEEKEAALAVSELNGIAAAINISSSSANLCYNRLSAKGRI